MRYGTPDGKWAKVEIMGHVEHIGRALEVPLLDGKALRVCDETEPGPILFGLGAIFSLRWLSDEEGEKEAIWRLEAWDEQGRRNAHGRVIGAIQQSIRELLADGKKMPLADLLAAVVAQDPMVDLADFNEAADGMSLDEISPEVPGGTPLYWIDPDGDCPF
jgi:hypothetical protein